VPDLGIVVAPRDAQSSTQTKVDMHQAPKNMAFRAANQADSLMTSTGLGAVRECNEAAEAAAAFPDADKTPADRSEAFLMLVTDTIRIVSDDLQWIVQTRKGRATGKSSGWRSRHFCRTREGLQEVLRRMFGRDAVPERVASAVQVLPAYHD
jgi:hypothetical protein